MSKNNPLSGPGSGGPAGHMMMGKKEKAKDRKGTLARLWTYLRHQKIGLALVFLTVFITTALNIAGPYLMKIALDSHISEGVHFSALLRILVAMAIVYALASLLTLIQQHIMIGLSQRAIRALRRDVFQKFQELTVRYFDTHSSGELMSRVTNDIDNISNTLSTGVLQVISAVLTLISVAVVMVSLNWPLALICLCVIPLVIFVTKKVGGHTRTGFRDRQKSLGKINGIIEENVSGHRVIKSFTKEEEIMGDFNRENEKMRRASYKANAVSGLMGPMMNMMNNLNYAVTAFAGGILALNGLVSVGTIAAFLNYSRQFSRPLNQVAQLYTSIQSALAGAERVFALLDEEPEFCDAPDALPLEEIEGQVILEDIHFRYKEDIPVLKGIDIHAEPGQTIALVGPTGAGKTTIINLLTRFYDYHRGTITIDGKDLRHIRKDDLRRSLGIVLQETFLFSGTVKENIRYGRLDATDEEIREAAKMANAHQFIHRMPKGYDTEISENGANLSEGQRQLIAIARAILSQPSILILDEATSSVDTRTEVQIQEGMLKLMEGRTSFVIAHRLSTIKNADAILVLKDGEIIERGTHGELLDARGFYHELYHSQFGKENVSTAS
ncbi:MAG: ABC transporter ATP-binding protein [Spirochaetales bacterium]|nr:ABC transporter ATP-binding protein [Spirochaetales bacterium]